MSAAKMTVHRFSLISYLDVTAIYRTLGITKYKHSNYTQKYVAKM